MITPVMVLRPLAGLVILVIVHGLGAAVAWLLGRACGRVDRINYFIDGFTGLWCCFLILVLLAVVWWFGEMVAQLVGILQ